MPRVSAASGLGDAESALLDALDLLGAYADAPSVRSADVLLAAERLHGVAVDVGAARLVAAGSRRTRHLPLVDLGDAGALHAPAPTRLPDVRLSPVGALALAAERGEVGPLPLALVEGSVLDGGEVPPFSPAGVVSALLAGTAYAGGPLLPGGGTVEGDVDALLRGEAVELVVGCALRDEVDRLVVTEVPGVTTPADVLRAVNRALSDAGPGRRPTGCGDALRDESSALDGVRLVLDIERRSNVARVVDWLRAVPPVTTTLACRLPAPMPDLLRTWDRGDGTGLRALADHLSPPY